MNRPPLHNPPPLTPSPRNPPTLTTLAPELLLRILSYTPLRVLPALHKTCLQFRALKPHFLTLIRQRRPAGSKLCTECLRLRPPADFPWHAPTHASELCLRHLDSWLCERKSCDLKYFAFKWNRMELELRLLGRWRAVRGVKELEEVDNADVEPPAHTRGACGNSRGGEIRRAPRRHLGVGRHEGPQRREDDDRAESDFMAVPSRTYRWSVASMIDEHLAELFMNTDFRFRGWQ